MVRLNSLPNDDTSMLRQSPTIVIGGYGMEAVLARLSEVPPMPSPLLILKKGDAVDVPLDGDMTNRLSSLCVTCCSFFWESSVVHGLRGSKTRSCPFIFAVLQRRKTYSTLRSSTQQLQKHSTTSMLTPHSHDTYSRSNLRINITLLYNFLFSYHQQLITQP